MLKEETTNAQAAPPAGPNALLSPSGGPPAVMADGDRFATAVISALAHQSTAETQTTRPGPPPAVAKELAPEPLGSATECEVLILSSATEREALITQAAPLVNLPNISRGPLLFQEVREERVGGPETGSVAVRWAKPLRRHQTPHEIGCSFSRTAAPPRAG